LCLSGGYFGGFFLDCVPCINRDVDVQSTAGDFVGALEEGGDEGGGDLLGFAVLELPEHEREAAGMGVRGRAGGVSGKGR